MNWQSLWKTGWFKILLVLLILIVGGLVGWFTHTQKAPVSVVSVRETDSGDRLINPILYVEVPESLAFPTYSPLKNALSNYVSSAESAKKVTAIAIYFKDMNSSMWTGINPTQKFDPASMLKVTVLIALLRTAEVYPAILSGTVSIPANAVIPNGAQQAYFPSTKPIMPGNTYTVQDLMSRLIVQSDDGAAIALTSLLGNNTVSTVFTDLQIPLPGSGTGVSPQQYSHLFRVLYNSTYLTSEDSEKSLELLSNTTYTAGLVAGVPSSVTVAHKFGESLSPPISAGATWPPTTSSSSDVPGLSDCGIIYYPNHPYFLCVMTQGTDFTTLASVIKDISNVTYAQVDMLYAKK